MFQSDYIVDIKCSNLYVNARPTLVTLDYVMDMAIIATSQQNGAAPGSPPKHKIDPHNRSARRWGGGAWWWWWWWWWRVCVCTCVFDFPTVRQRTCVLHRDCDWPATSNALCHVEEVEEWRSIFHEWRTLNEPLSVKHPFVQFSTLRHLILVWRKTAHHDVACSIEDPRY